MSKLFWIAIAAGLAVAALAFVTRRPRDAKRETPRLDLRTLQKAPLDQIAAALREGRKIDAIKLMRESTGVDLKQAKDAVEEMEKRLPLLEKMGLGETKG
jgi:ribosomal protein L7/L12